jgi:hypothetical protein
MVATPPPGLVRLSIDSGQQGIPMIDIRTLDGHDINMNENAIVLIAGSLPPRCRTHTYVYGVPQSVLVTAEKPDLLVARLRIDPSLAKLTRPDRSPIWVKGSAVTSVREPIATEQQGQER